MTSETYYNEVIPTACTLEPYVYNPMLYFFVYKINSEGIWDLYAYYERPDAYHLSIIITDYEPNDEYQIAVEYSWYDSSAKDYTVKLQSKHDLELTDYN